MCMLFVFILKIEEKGEERGGGHEKAVKKCISLGDGRNWADEEEHTGSCDCICNFYLLNLKVNI